MIELLLELFDLPDVVSDADDTEKVSRFRFCFVHGRSEETDRNPFPGSVFVRHVRIGHPACLNHPVVHRLFEGRRLEKETIDLLAV